MLKMFKTSSKKKVVLPSSDNSSDDDNEVICDDTDSDEADDSKEFYLRLRRSEKAALASLDDDMVGNFMTRVSIGGRSKKSLPIAKMQQLIKLRSNSSTLLAI